MSATSLLLVLLIIFLSTLIRATLGFGNALLAMPLLVLTVGITIATPLVAFVSAVLAVIMLITHWQEVDLKAAWQLALSSFLGIPFGLVLLTIAPISFVTTVLGVLLATFGAYNLTTFQLPTLRWAGWAYVFGFAGGILGGAYNTNGPAIITYAVLCRWPPTRFRATLQSYFLLTGLVILISHGIAGLWTSEVLQLFLYSLPVIALSLFLGGKLNTYISHQQFEHLVHLTLICMGILLLV